MNYNIYIYTFIYSIVPLLFSSLLSSLPPPQFHNFGTLIIGANSEVNLSASENLIDDGTTEPGLLSILGTVLLLDNEKRNGKGGSSGDKVLQSCAADLIDFSFIIVLAGFFLVNINFCHHLFSVTVLELALELLLL